MLGSSRKSTFEYIDLFAGISSWLCKPVQELYCPNNTRPDLQIRMMVGLSLLKHACDLSDEEVVEWWFDSSYVPEEIASARVWRMITTKLA